MSDQNDCDPSVITENQPRVHVASIAHGVPQDIIHDVCNYANTAEPLHKYTIYAKMPFIFEILDMEGWSSKVRDLVDSWIQVSSTITSQSFR